MRHLIDPLDFTLEETTKVLDLADRIAESPEVYSHVADGKKIATLFYFIGKTACGALLN